MRSSAAGGGQEKRSPEFTGDFLSYSGSYAEAMELYRPSRIRLLFIAEAPPAHRFHRFFYFDDVRRMDTLFLEMMKTLYPKEVGYHDGQFLPGHSAASIRRRKSEFLTRFRADGFYLTDAHELPMPDAASSKEKAGLMRGSLPHLLEKIQTLSGNHAPPIVLIGKVTYKVCAAVLRDRGFVVLNRAAIDHPARGGQRRFREGLAQTFFGRTKTANGSLRARSASITLQPGEWAVRSLWPTPSVQITSSATGYRRPKRSRP